MGVAGTFTPLHRDVCELPALYVARFITPHGINNSDASYSWSTNITGSKIWYLFPPSVSHHLRRYPSRNSSEIVYDIRNVNQDVFKEFDQARQKMLVVEQPPGSTIFM